MSFVRRLGQVWFGRGLIVFVAVLMLVNCATIAMAQEGGTDTSAAPDKLSSFEWFIHCNGFIGIIILIVSVGLVALIARTFVELRMQTAMPPEIIAQCEAMLEQRDFKGIFNVVKEDDSFFSRVLVTGITELPNGLSEAREAMERIGDMLTHRHGEENQPDGRDRHAGADDRPGGNALGDDPQPSAKSPAGPASRSSRTGWPRLFPRPSC